MTPPVSTPPGVWARAAYRALLGVMLALGVTELGFRARDGGAFPLVNLYAPDERCGVRLRPDDETIVGTRRSPKIVVRTNGKGFRGPEWPAPRTDEILVVGDSQAFGLGVAEGERFPAVLSRELAARSVLDASVPTYGPDEYRITLTRVLAERRPATVVVALNLLNDLSELGRPNLSRYMAVDGWAARIGEEAPPPASPFRELVIRRSHAAFAWWRFQRMRQTHTNLAPIDALAELSTLATEAAYATGVSDAARGARDSRAAALAADEAERDAAKDDVVARAHALQGLFWLSDPFAAEWAAYVRHRGEPEDESFTLRYGGCAAPPVGSPVEYRARFKGGRIRADVEAKLRELARVLTGERGASLRAALDRRDAAEARLAASRLEAPPPPPPTTTPLAIEAYLREVDELSRAHGARLLVLIVPLDAQVSEDVAARRALTQATVADIHALADRLARTVQSLGALAVNPTDELRRAGPSTFLEDGHLSPEGHRTVAAAVARELTRVTPAD